MKMLSRSILLYVWDQQIWVEQELSSKDNNKEMYKPVNDRSEYMCKTRRDIISVHSFKYEKWGLI